ncbi:EthD domain-containing protein [Bradyrhizobium sp. Rc3b]|uniref:EthD domain-containing protein n=1 Tax=Bradyrhizobium sp. Rc3b TaxID=1855322 RepID=UPI0008E42FD8|nr:EthD domain-containing protein [Bradyrhizobium sp. Rc3b]SFM49730.1 EthD domain-containing protein [Bradyrhizobium sp. Rc3b]
MTSSELRQRPLYLLKRNPMISQEQFGKHWFEVHAAVLKSIPEWPRLRSGYVQNHLIGSGLLGELPFPYDGVAQVYVRPGTEGGPSFPEMPVFRERVIPDEEAFLDRGRVVVLKTLEHVVLPGAGAVKVFIFHRRRAGLSPQDFSNRWRTAHRDIVLAQEDFTRGLRGYRQDHTIPDATRYLAGGVVPAHEDFDGASEFWFDSSEAANAAFNASGYTRRIRDDASDVFDLSREIACLVDPRVILPE